MATKKIKINFFLAVAVAGVVKANYYANSLEVLSDLRKDFPGCDIEVFDVSKYGFDFGEAPVITIDGVSVFHRIRCVETGKVWNSVKECCDELNLPITTMYNACRKGSRIFGYHYEKIE